MRRATESASYDCRRAGISIHALHEESDEIPWELAVHGDGSSIHALHEESDRARARWPAAWDYFNPRSP